MFLVGMMGSGKSTIGPLLARRLDYAFIDLDARLTEHHGESIADMFALGEDTFREREADLLRAIDFTKSVVATGGGTPLYHGNMSYMRSIGHVVFLDVPPAELARRLGNGDGRPLLAGGDVLARVTSLLDARRAGYEDADLVVRAGASSPATVVAGIERELVR